jgi:polyisoprenoid-binding protein YceI
MRWTTLLCALLASTGARAATFELDARQSDLTVHVRKKGLFSAFEHDHFLHPHSWSGTLEYDEQHPERARIELSVGTASFSDAQPKLSPSNRAKVENQIRSPMVLDAARFPLARFVAERITIRGRGAGAIDGEANGTLSLHGQLQPLVVTFHARTGGERVAVHGHTELAQTRFGIKPSRKAGGAIAVQDAVTIDFDAVFVAAPPRSRARRAPVRP